MNNNIKSIYKLYALLHFSSAKKECMKGIDSKCVECKYYYKTTLSKQNICFYIFDGSFTIGAEQKVFDQIELFLNQWFKGKK